MTIPALPREQVPTLPPAPPGMRRADTAFAWIAVLLFVTVLAVPGAPDSPFGAAYPSSPARLLLVGALGLATSLMLFRPKRTSAAGLALLAALALVKVGLGAASPVTGWQGVYEITDSTPPFLARFPSRFASPPYRIDPEIGFSGSGFGLHFLNDSLRYGHESALRERDVDLPLRISWTGYVALPDSAPITVYLRGSGTFWLELDGRGWHTTTDPDFETVVTPGPARAGVHQLRIVYEKPRKVMPAASVLATANDRVLIPAPTSGDAGRERKAALAASVTTGLVALAVLVVAWTIVAALVRARFETRRGPRLVAFATLAFTIAFACTSWQHARPTTGTTVNLGAGDDPLIYEASARDIVLHGLMMPMGSEVGHGIPFYFYPLYPYVRAATIFLVGEDFAAALLLSGFAIALLGPLFWGLGWSRLPAWRGLAGLGLLAWVTQRHIVYYTRWGFTDCVFIALVFAALWATTSAVRSGRLRVGVVAGIAAGLASACRPSLMTFTPLLALAVVFWPTPWTVPKRMALAVALVGGFLIGTSPFAIRNYVMSGQPVLLVNSWIQLPYFLYPPEVANPVQLNGGAPPTLGQSVAWAWRVFSEDPVRALSVEGRKLAFCAGFTNLGFPGESHLQAWHPEFTVFTVLFAVAIATRALPWSLTLVLVAFSAAHVIAMVIAAPWTYGYKSILPLQGVFLFAVAYLGCRQPRGHEHSVTGESLRPSV